MNHADQITFHALGVGSGAERIGYRRRLHLSRGINAVRCEYRVLQIEAEDLSGRYRFAGGSEISFSGTDLVTLTIVDAAGRSGRLDVFTAPYSIVRFVARAAALEVAA